MLKLDKYMALSLAVLISLTVALAVAPMLTEPMAVVRHGSEDVAKVELIPSVRVLYRDGKLETYSVSFSTYIFHTISMQGTISWVNVSLAVRLVLSDRFLAESYSTVEPFAAGRVSIDRGKLLTEAPPGGYRRYAVTEDGVSPRALPGTEGVIVRANSSEHDEEGFGSSDPAVVRAMVGKRLRKAELMREEVEKREDSVKVYGSAEPRVTLIAWGSVKGPALEALRELEERGVPAALVQVVFLAPFPAGRLRRVLDALSRPYLLVENNSTAQLGSLLREHLCLRPDEVLVAREPVRSSARNCLPGVVESVRREGLFYAVTLRCANLSLTAYVTKASLEDLSLKEGEEVYAVFKVSSLNPLRGSTSHLS